LAFSDTRLKPPKVYGRSGYDPGGLDHASIQSLLKISGRDSESVGQLYKKAWEGELVCKIIITANDPLNIQDPVLLGRLVLLDFQQSWLDRDDRDDYLREKLDAELPGIANRCLTAYRRLLARGHFIQPKSAAHLAKVVAEKVNPLAAFMDDRWIKDDKARPGPLAGDVHYSFERWCEENHRSNLLETYPRPQELMKAIKALDGFRELNGVRHTGETTFRYPGIRRRKKSEEDIAQAEVVLPKAKEAVVVRLPNAGYRRVR
jgi:putative DNA primase/helicase